MMTIVIISLLCQLLTIYFQILLFSYTFIPVLILVFLLVLKTCKFFAGKLDYLLSFLIHLKLTLLLALC